MRANVTATLSTLTTITLTLLILGAVLLVNTNLNRTLSGLERQAEVAAFLTPDADGAALLGHVQSMTGVSSAELIPKDQVLAEMTRDYPYTQQAAALAGNPFPDTLRMRVADVEQTRVVAAAAGMLQGVESVEYGAGYVDQAARTLATLRTVGTLLVGLLLGGTLLSILNAVQISMYARRSEINVMRMLGATRSFIQWPYLIEGVLLGLGGAALAGLVLLPVAAELTRRAAELVPALPLAQGWGHLLTLWLGLAALGAIVGLLGGWLASGRYLQELE
ncbi:FtsX-like permease family protein [Deinococcus radiophilus]|uniref:Cell division protein FtsX n=2 Tax=Deinococcus radiophilus TaxID=32062 RepID=A0A431VYL1_9DEIO|nr:FtsX-like permease family protein [Deinococcus radiophilus]